MSWSLIGFISFFILGYMIGRASHDKVMKRLVDAEGIICLFIGILSTTNPENRPATVDFALKEIKKYRSKWWGQ